MDDFRSRQRIGDEDRWHNSLKAQMGYGGTTCVSGRATLAGPPDLLGGVQVLWSFF
jgi:hypothetical protein